MAWATKEQARRHWPDADALADDVLDDLLDEAYPACVAYAPPLLDRTVTDGVTTSGSYSVTSATAKFQSNDLGRSVTGTGIPADSRIITVIDSTTVILSAAVTATGTAVSLTVDGIPASYVKANILQAREVYAASQRGESDVIGVGDYAIRARPLTAAVKQLLRPRKPSWKVG